MRVFAYTLLFECCVTDRDLSFQRFDRDLFSNGFFVSSIKSLNFVVLLTFSHKACI